MHRFAAGAIVAIAISTAGVAAEPEASASPSQPAVLIVRSPAESPPEARASADEANPWLTTVLWAALAAVVSALVTASWTRATKISEFRQAWINDLRSDIADYIGQAGEWRQLVENVSGRAKATKEQRAAIDASRRKAFVLLTRISLRFNPLENPHLDADTKFLNDLGGLLQDTPPLSLVGWTSLSAKVERDARIILKREWEVTKKLFPGRANMPSPQGD